MIDATQIKEHAEIISADGLHVGTVDRVEGSRIKLTKKDSGAGHEVLLGRRFLPVWSGRGPALRISVTAK